MTLSDSDDVQTISSGSEDNKEREKVTTGRESWKKKYLNLHHTDNDLVVLSVIILFFLFLLLWLRCD